MCKSLGVNVTLNVFSPSGPTLVDKSFSNVNPSGSVISANVSIYLASIPVGIVYVGLAFNTLNSFVTFASFPALSVAVNVTVYVPTSVLSIVFVISTITSSS